MYLNSFAFTHFFEFFTGVRDVGNNYGSPSFGFVCGAVVVGGLVGLLDCCWDWLNLWCHWLRAQEGN